MNRSKTPQEKKKESYAHDRVDRGEYPHADRRNRPLLKARGRRQLRRASKQLLTSQPEDVLQFPGRSRLTWHDSGIRLPEHVERTRRHRIEREAHNIFRRGYGPATHARFRSVVESWMKGGSEQSRSRAEFYTCVLTQFSDEPQWRGLLQGLQQRRDFLSRFFGKEPELKRRFQIWIATLKNRC